MAESIVESSAEAVLNVTKTERIRVLHVDDDLTFLSIAKQCLEMQGSFQVDMASSVEEAMEKMKKETYAAVVSDYQMPGKDGLNFLKELRDAGNNIPFIILTGKGREEIATKALNLGADGYFNKIGSPETVYGELAHGISQIVKGKRTEEALGTNEGYLRAILDSMFTGLIVIDEKTHKICDANFHALETIAAPREDVIGKICHKFICPAEEGKCPITDLGQTIDRSERVLLRADGQRIPILKTVSTITQRGRKYLIESFVDITERKKAEEVLRENEEKFRNLAEESPNMIFINKKGRVVYANEKAEQAMGYAKEEFYSPDFNFLKLIAPESRELIKSGFAKHMKGEEAAPFEYKLLTKQGGTVDAILTSKLITYDGESAILGTVTDITGRRQEQEAVRRSEEQARRLLEFQNKVIDTAIVWIDVLDREGNVTLWNRAAELISGYSREEVIGHKKIWEWLYPDPQYCAKIFAHQRRAIEHKESAFRNFETVIRCKNGALKTISWYSNSITDGEGKPVGSIAIGLDVSQLKEAENELHGTMEKLEMMNEKLRVVGGLTRHDVNNKLAAITGNAYLAREKLPGNSEVLDYMKQIEASVKQTVQIFDFARAYEMLGVEELVHVDVEKSVNEAVSLFSGLKDIKVINDCHGLTVLADSLLRQLFYNLIDDSLKYGEKLSCIRVYYEDKNGHLNLTYEDDGVGIPQAAKPKLFGEGYTTGKGSGYGLFLVKRIMEVYGWTIQETGTQGTGAQFIISIPRTKKDGKENYRLS